MADEIPDVVKSADEILRMLGRLTLVLRSIGVILGHSKPCSIGRRFLPSIVVPDESTKEHSLMGVTAAWPPENEVLKIFTPYTTRYLPRPVELVLFDPRQGAARVGSGILRSPLAH